MYIGVGYYILAFQKLYFFLTRGVKGCLVEKKISNNIYIHTFDDYVDVYSIGRYILHRNSPNFKAMA